MKYEFDDIFTHSLPRELLNEFNFKFINDVVGKYKRSRAQVSGSERKILEHVRAYCDSPEGGYQDSAEYMLAESNVARAEIAIRAELTPNPERKRKVLELWQTFADQMSDTEKILEEWTKV